MAKIDPKRGEVWKLRKVKTVGQEIGKGRRVVVMNVRKAGRQEMRIIIPITTGRDNYDNLFWMTRIPSDSANGLDHDSFADASQIQAVSLKRFSEQTGVIQSQELLDKMAAAIVLSVGYSPGNRKRKRR